LLLDLFELVAQAFALTDEVLEKQQEVVGQAFKDRVTLLGREGTRPGFALTHLAFELVEDFLDVPAVLVEQDDLIGGQSATIGDSNSRRTACGVCWFPPVIGIAWARAIRRSPLLGCLPDGF